MTVSISKDIEVDYVKAGDIKLRFRLRTPNQERVDELAESIEKIGLLSPPVVDNDNFLVVGNHRRLALVQLGYTEIPVIRKDFSKEYSELAEIDENLKVAPLSKIEVAEHIVKREEIYSSLGLKLKRGFNESAEGLISTEDLAREVGLKTARAYRLRRQPSQILEEVRNQLRNTRWAEVLTDMIKLSQQPPDVQKAVADVLLSGKCETFRKGLVLGNIEVMRRTNDYKVGFNIKERWGKVPHSIMRFLPNNKELLSICNEVAKDPELEWSKREGLHFGETTIPVYKMVPDHAEFLVTYYTQEGAKILDQFMGRGTIGFASIYHNREFVGYDVGKKNVDKVREVMTKEFPDAKFTLHHSDGIALDEYKNEANYFDAVCCDPPFVLKAEKYPSGDERDLSTHSHKQYMKKIYRNFQELYRLIKVSDFKKKIFYPVIFKVGTGRLGSKGIIDMDFEFQQAAKSAGFHVWDKVINELNTPWGAVNWERNYMNRYVQKNYETNIVFVRF